MRSETNCGGGRENCILKQKMEPATYILLFFRGDCAIEQFLGKTIINIQLNLR